MDNKKRQKKYFSVFTDSRLLPDCVYCGKPVEDRDHIPAKVFLIEPYPVNLDVLQSCRSCNGGASKDEEYVACAIEILKQSTLDLSLLRSEVAKTLSYQKKLYDTLKSDVIITKTFGINIHVQRFENVFLKLVKGHAAHELSLYTASEDCKLQWAILEHLSNAQIDEFLKPPSFELYPEIGSRGFQRIVEHGNLISWIEVQKEHYYYMAYVNHQGSFVRIFLSNFIVVSAHWPRF